MTPDEKRSLIDEACARSIIEADELTPEEAVENGLRFMDEQAPDWADVVDLDTFDIENSESCVFGQVYGGWWRGMQETGVDETPVLVWLGLTEADHVQDNSPRFRDLQPLWVEAIESRQAGAPR